MLRQKLPMFKESTPLDTPRSCVEVAKCSKHRPKNTDKHCEAKRNAYCEVVSSARSLPKTRSPESAGDNQHWHRLTDSQKPHQLKRDKSNTKTNRTYTRRENQVIVAAGKRAHNSKSKTERRARINNAKLVG